MYTYFEIHSEIDKGMVFRLSPTLRLGSGECEIRLRDPDLPAVHSQILLNHKNQMVLVCTNAVFETLINGKPTKKVVLLNGITIQVANTILKVITSTKPIVGAIDPRPQPLEPQQETRNWAEDSPEPLTKIRISESESPKHQLLQELRKLAEGENPVSESPMKTFRLFRQPVHLKLETGPQADDEFVLSWGPRDFGPMALEFPIEFPPFPAVLFTLSPGENGEIIFSTKHPDFVRVSGQTESTCVIADGAKIEAGNSTILIEHLKGFDGHDKG